MGKKNIRLKLEIECDPYVDRSFFSNFFYSIEIQLKE